MRRSPADSTNRYLATFGKLQHIRFKYFGLAASTPSCENDERDPIPESENRDGFNIEGLVMAPYSASTAFVGFRAPLVPSVGEPAAEPGAAGKPARTHALLVSVTNFDELSANGGTPGTARFGPPIRMDLGGRGIRSIDKNDRNEYVIVAGPPGSANGEAPGDFRLFTWNGLPASPPQLRTADLSALTPPNFQGSIEGIVSVPAPLTSASLITLVSDNGDTDYYEDGTEAKDLPQASHQKFRTDVVFPWGDPVRARCEHSISAESCTCTANAVSAAARGGAMIRVATANLNPH